MQPLASPVPSASTGALYDLGAFKNSKKEDTASFKAEDIKAILHQVQHGNADERELAIDILVNLAAGKDDASAQAQGALSALYADPYGTDKSDPPVSQQAKDDIRRGLGKAAHRMCELALTHAFQPKDGKGRALSVTVACLGALHPDCAADFKRDINQYVHSQMKFLGDNERNEDWLAPQRTVSQAELSCVSEQAYGEKLDISQSAVNLALDVQESPTPETAQKAQEDFKQSMKALTNGMKVGECRTTWVHTGSEGYPHWMPMVVRRKAHEEFEFVLLNTDGKQNEARAGQIENRLITLLSAPGVLDATWEGDCVRHDAQVRAGNGCAPLGHEFLKTFGAKLDGGSGQTLKEITDDCTGRWDNMSAEDMTAMVQGNRAELLNARAQLGDGMAMPEHARGSRAAVMPAGPEPRLPMDDTRHPAGFPQPAPLPSGAQLPSGEPPLLEPAAGQSAELLGAKAPIETVREKLDRLIKPMGLALEKGRESENKPAPYTSAFVGLAESTQAAMPQQGAKLNVSKLSVRKEIASDKQDAQKFLAGLNSNMNDSATAAQLSKLSPSMKPLFGALVVAAQAWMQNTRIHAIGDPGLASRLPNVSKLGILALAAQLPVRIAMPLERAMQVAMPLDPATQIAMANNSPGPADLRTISFAMDEVVNFIDGRQDLLNMAIADLQEIIDSPSSGDSPALKSEANDLLAALKSLQKEFQKPDGAIQSARQFAELACDCPLEAHAAMRERLAVQE